LKRGDVVIAAAKGEFGGKPRPYVIVQSDEYDTPRIIVVGCTTAISGEPDSIRPLLLPSNANGLVETCEVMIDNPVTTRRDRVQQVVGALSTNDMDAVERALVLVLGLASGR